jgi:hypothetical protein
MKYMRRTNDMFVIYGGGKELVRRGYTNASFVTDPNNFKSQSSYMFTLNKDAVKCNSFKHILS